MLEIKITIAAPEIAASLDHLAASLSGAKITGITQTSEEPEDGKDIKVTATVPAEKVPKKKARAKKAETPQAADEAVENAEQPEVNKPAMPEPEVPQTAPAPVAPPATPAYCVLGSRPAQRPAPVALPATPAEPAAPAIPTPAPAVVVPQATPEQAFLKMDPKEQMNAICRAGVYLAQADPEHFSSPATLLKKYGVMTLTQLKPEQLPQFAAELRAMGAKI